MRRFKPLLIVLEILLLPTALFGFWILSDPSRAESVRQFLKSCGVPVQ